MMAREAVAHRLRRCQGDARGGSTGRATHVVVQGGDDTPRVSAGDVDLNDNIFMRWGRLRRVGLQLACRVDDAGQRRVAGEAEHEGESRGPDFSGCGAVGGHLQPTDREVRRITRGDGQSVSACRIWPRKRSVNQIMPSAAKRRKVTKSSLHIKKIMSSLSR